MSSSILRSADYQRMPWKNGGGTTTEIWKDTDLAGRMLWRLSIADVASDGPFSEFPGIDRWIMVIEGEGMELDIAGMGHHRLDRLFEPLAFPGDAATDCRLIAGPIRDFNLMVSRDHGHGSLQVQSYAPSEVGQLADELAAVHVLRGQIKIESDAPCELAEGDTWICGIGSCGTIHASTPATVALITIEQRRRVAAR